MSDFDRFARFYDADYGAHEADLGFYAALARRTGGPIIELMCGSGRVLLPLARAGFQLTGVDVSPQLLRHAEHKIAAAGVAQRVALHAGDVRAPLPGGPYALAIVALNSFMHLEETADQIAALEQIAAVLEPGGLLVLDLYNPDPRELARHNGELVFDSSFVLDGAQVQKYVVQSADLANQHNHVTFIYDEIRADGQLFRTTLPFTMRWLYRFELEHLLARCGFEFEAVYGSYDLDDYASNSDLLLAVARRIEE